MYIKENCFLNEYIRLKEENLRLKRQLKEPPYSDAQMCMMIDTSKYYDEWNKNLCIQK